MVESGAGRKGRRGRDSRNGGGGFRPAPRSRTRKCREGGDGEEPAGEPRPQRRRLETCERPRQLRPAAVERDGQRPRRGRAGTQAFRRREPVVVPEQTRTLGQAQPAGAALREPVRVRARRRTVHPDAARTEAEQRLAEQPEHDQPVRWFDLHLQRTVAVDDLGVHAGQRHIRQFEAVVERDRRSTRVRGRGTRSRETGENDDRQRSEAHHDTSELGPGPGHVRGHRPGTGSGDMSEGVDQVPDMSRDLVPN